MKKIISLLASIAMLASMAIPVSAAELANNTELNMDVSFVQEVSAEEYPDWTGEVLEEGYKAYLLDVMASNLDLSSKATSKTGAGKTNRDGVVLMQAGVQINIDDPSKIGTVIAVDGPMGNGATVGAVLKDGVIVCEFVAGNSKQSAPNVNDGSTTVVTATEVLTTEIIVTVKGSVTATVTKEPTAKVTAFTAGASTDTLNFGAAWENHATSTVNGEAGGSITLGTVTPDPDPEPVENIVWTDRMDLEAEDLKGAAWDVTIKKFDSAKTYVATFTNTADSTDIKTRDMDLSYFAEANGAEVNFVALLKLNKDRIVDLKVEEKE